MQTSLTDELQVLRDLSLFAALSETELCHVASRLERRRFRRGEVIYHKNDRPAGLYIMLSGEVKTRVLLPDDRQFTFHLFHRGGYFGTHSLFDDRERSTDAVAVTDCRVLFFQKDAFFDFIHRHPPAAYELLRVMAAMYRTAVQAVQDIALLDVSTRVAKELAHLAGSQSSDWLDDPGCLTISQSELAALIGATRESTNKWLRFYEQEGWIELSRRHIRIKNLDGLRRRAAEEY